MFENGYIERLIRQIGAIVTRASLGRRESEQLVSPEEIDAAWSELLGIPEGLLDVIDATTLASLLGTPEKRKLGADLLEADADERRRKLGRELRALL